MSKTNDNQIINEIANLRRKIKTTKGLYILVLVYIICAFLFGFVFNFAGYLNGLLLKLICGAVLVVMVIYLLGRSKKLNKELKNFFGENVVKEILAEKIDIIKYEPDKYGEEMVNNCRILPHYDRISGSDYTVGVYRGVQMAYCDLMLEEEVSETDSEGITTTSHETVFRGQLLNLKLTKQLNGFVRIKERMIHGKGNGIIHEMFSGAANLLGIKSNSHIIEVESVDFNNRFEIRTNNDELTFYILTPQFMNSIIKADQYADGLTNLEFFDNEVYIALYNKRDAFELSKDIDNINSLEENRRSIRNDLNKILSIVDEIINNNKLFD